MKPRTSQFIESKPSRRRAVALLMVLAFLVLIAASIVGFFATSASARRDSAGYESGIAVKQLADIVTNVVLGQIADGTRSWEIPPATPSAKGAGARLTYATQPGLIRTYTDTGATGRIFKLYSSDTMVTAPGGIWSVSNQLANEVPANWPGMPALFTDLNQPVLVEDSSGLITQAGSTRKFTAAYPILNPLALIPISGGAAGVEGFDLQGVPGYKGGAGRPAITTSNDPTAPAGTGLTSNPAPMPVRWIYVLQDGTLTTPAASAANTLAADWSSLPDSSPLKPTKTNPIVGRVAFWTDDETCKLNINTSSEPTPWDTPRAVDIQDLNYGKYQPAQHEFQRFPGHPFTTALSPVLFPGVTLSTQQKEDIYSVIPRVNTGGSKAATVVANSAGLATITPDTERLFASPEELVFAVSNSSGQRDENPTSASTLPKFREQLKRARFFLTASSRAPEVNLLGQPRISIWPVNSNAAQRTAIDTLAAFCTSLGTTGTAKQYYFQRANATSPTADYDQIPRNQDLYRWLQDTTSKDIPGYGGNFLKKWGADRDQILTEIFDYIRCVNLRDSLLVQQGLPRYADDGQVAPIQISNNTQGFGRFHSISQFGMHFICAQNGTSGAITSQYPALSPGQSAVEAAFLFEPFSVSLGYYELLENITYQVTFKSPMSLDGTDLKFPTGTTSVSSTGGAFGNIWHGRHWGGAQGVRGAINKFGGAGYPFIGTMRAKVGGPGKTTMSFSGGTIEVKVFAGAASTPVIQTFTITFPPANIPIPTLVNTGTATYRGTSTSTPDVWWTFKGYTEINGTAHDGRYKFASECPHAPGPEYTDPNRRWGTDNGGNPPGFKRGSVFRAEDVVRTVVPINGDLRLIAATKDPSSMFTKGNSYDDATVKLDHIFSEPQGPHMLYGFANEPGPAPAPGLAGNSPDSQLVPSTDVKYHYARMVEIRSGAGKLYNKWNDFDNGFAHITDGAYINKPDEGNVASQNSSYPYFSWDFAVPSEILFSPCRLIPSAGMFGSLPTGVKRNQPWQTLLFRPELRAATTSPHPGTQSPKDHLIMDLFWMPAVEPYAISEPFSTSGKVNLNYEIAPFSYIRRTTALRGAMKAEEPLQIPNAASKFYKLWDHETNDWNKYPNDPQSQDAQVRTEWTKLYTGQPPYDRLRRPIDAEKTLKQADDRFAAGNAFRSATEICELHLVRDTEQLDDYKNDKIWPNALFTGDNTRERPYTNLYAKLTTKSNTFNVHMRVQVLRKRPSTTASDYAVWNEDSDTIVAEHRGSALVERYIDASDPNLPDFATNSNATLDNYARFRILSTSKFAP